MGQLEPTFVINMRESDSLLILGNQYKTIHIDKGTNQKQVLPMAAMCLSDQEVS
jgi:hypothetical protein